MAETVKLQVRVDVGAAALKLGEAAGPMLIAALQGGLLEGGQYAVGEAVMEAREKKIQSRTGSLLGSISSFDGAESESDLELKVGVPVESPASRYAYLLEEGVKTITPVKGQYLTIPIGANMTPAGVPRYSSPRDPELEEGFFLRVGQALYYGLSNAKGVFNPLFQLVRRSTVKGRNVLGPALERARPTMVEIVQERVDALLNAE
ncbi:MAG: hypothetical protein SF069_02975 [Phycisphaerae bacterium]|nr:hypothetical protein [Phycisphaerae bacterium]